MWLIAMKVYVGIQKYLSVQTTKFIIQLNGRTSKCIDLQAICIILFVTSIYVIYNEIEVVWACDENRGALRRKESDGNGSAREKKERKTLEKIVGQCEG